MYRLAELVFRWRARNWPDSLSESEQLRWQQHCAQVLGGEQPQMRSAEQMSAEIDALYETADEAGQAILEALYEWLEAIAPEL